jgi:hypothetical protein
MPWSFRVEGHLLEQCQQKWPKTWSIVDPLAWDGGSDTIKTLWGCRGRRPLQLTLCEQQQLPYLGVTLH